MPYIPRRNKRRVEDVILQYGCLNHVRYCYPFSVKNVLQLKVLEKAVLGKIFEPKGDELSEE
jgi:hypothetical protein